MNEGRTANYTAVRHLLASPSIESRTAPHVGHVDFDWSGLAAVAATMSAGEQLLVAIAQDLWNADDRSVCATWRAGWTAAPSIVSSRLSASPAASIRSTHCRQRRNPRSRDAAPPSGHA